MSPSVVDTRVVGQFMHPVIDENTPESDPWTRNYSAPPPHAKNLVPRSFPLTDIRPELEKSNYDPAKFLQTHGFSVVKHQSAVLAQPDVSEDQMIEEYIPEIKDLVLKVTGAKVALVQIAGIRRGKDVAEEYKMPTEVKRLTPDYKATEQKEEPKPEQKSAEPSISKKRLMLASPVRVPHMDYTPLGARQTIRFQSKEVYEAATDSGVIAAEDAICKEHTFGAQSEEANSVIEEQYNRGGLGPRYAAYSIWRPLKTVGRDPITLAARKKENRKADIGGELVHWPYLNRSRGAPELSGKDWLKEFAMLGVKGREPPATVNDDDAETLKFYYVSKQQPDEVIFIQLFDSASLGPDSQQAGAPYHGSPEIGNVEGSQARESCDVRVIVFW